MQTLIHTRHGRQIFFYSSRARGAPQERDIRAIPRRGRKIPPGDVTWRDLESRANRRSSSNHFLPRNPQTNPRRRPSRFRETLKDNRKAAGAALCTARRRLLATRRHTHANARKTVWISPRSPAHAPGRAPREARLDLPPAREVPPRDRYNPPPFRPGRPLALLPPGHGAHERRPRERPRGERRRHHRPRSRDARRDPRRHGKVRRLRRRSRLGEVRVRSVPVVPNRPRRPLHPNSSPSSPIAD